MKPAPLLTTLALAAATVVATRNSADRIQLSKIGSLTLRNGQMTKGRRSDPAPQLLCVGGTAKGLYEVDVMRCKNMGSDYDDDDISWACTADVPGYFKLGSTDVVCEGYDNPDDPYVLKGSCGVEYRLALTESGYEKYGEQLRRSSPLSSFSSGGGDGPWPVLFHVVFWSMLAFILYNAYLKIQRDPRGPRSAAPAGGGRPSFWGGGGGGGGSGGDDPPPPYDYPSSKPSSQEQWRPGFWSGLAAGAAGSHLLRGSGGGGGGVGGSRREETRRPPLFGSSSSSGESSSAGAERHSSTGFGQTRRR